MPMRHACAAVTVLSLAQQMLDLFDDPLRLSEIGGAFVKCDVTKTEDVIAAILDDPEASPNDRFVATELLKNACIAATRSIC